MSIFNTQNFTKIKGLSDRRRLPRLGKIRLGFKVQKNGKEFPAELPFFLLPDEVGKQYGFKDAETALQKAKDFNVTRADVLQFISQNYYRLADELKVMFPINDAAVVFPQALKRYGSSKGIICQGDGENAIRFDGGKECMEEISCPCEHLKSKTNPTGSCVQRANLRFFIPNVSMGGIYEIVLSSFNSIVDINSGFDFVTAMIGRFAMVMLTLKREPTETHHDGKKQIHYTLKLYFNVDVNMLDSLRSDTQRVITQPQFLLPPPDDTNPLMDKELEVVFNADAIEVQAENVREDVSVEIIENQPELIPPCITERVEFGCEENIFGKQREGLINDITEIKKKYTQKKKIVLFKKIREKYPTSVDGMSIGDLITLKKELEDS